MYQNWPSLTCQKQYFEPEEENHSIPPPPPDVYQNVRGYSNPQTCTQRRVRPKGFCSLHIVRPKSFCSLRIVRLCQNCNSCTFPEFQNCKGFCEDLKAPSLQILAFMKFVNALHLERLAKHRHLGGKKNHIFSSFALVATWMACLVCKI
jgi:hypothetical protein